MAAGHNRMDKNSIPISKVFGWVRQTLAPERNYIWLAIIYGIGISLFTLAVPISVQMLINTVANTALVEPLIILAAALFILLAISGILNALRVHLMEIFGRRFYARMVSEIALITIYAQNPFFYDQGKSSLFNRYFDIVIIQKAVPYLLIGGYTVILQAAVGFVIVSMYHPLFLGFNIVLILLIWLIWLIWGRGAIRSAIDLSHAKHETARWIEGLGGSNGYFKSRKHIESALIETDQATATYIDASRRHFRHTFAQTIAFLFLYAAASALLLGFGGWLVIIGELSLGQLVAAELILSAVFYGVSQLGVYFTSFFDLCAAIEELWQFRDVKQEIPDGEELPAHVPSKLSFERVKGTARGEDVLLDFSIEPGARVAARAKNHAVQRFFTNLLKHHVKPEAGIVSFAGEDVMGIEVHELRQRIMILDRPTLVETTIRNHLKRSARDGIDHNTLEAVEVAGLSDTLALLKDGMDTKLASTGYPLSSVELLQLKLASALLAEPDIIVLNQLFDMLPCEILSRVFDIFESRKITVIYFTNRTDCSICHEFLSLDPSSQSFEATRAMPGTQMIGHSNGNGESE